MSDWRELCTRLDDVVVDGEGVRVRLGSRGHGIEVTEKAEVIELRAVVAKQGVVESGRGPAYAAWRRNRAASVVGFRIDSDGLLIGESWGPRAGLTADELHFYLTSLAAACDRFEYHLTGMDVE